MLLIFLFFKSQSQTIEEVALSVTKFYNTETLSYSFEKLYYSDISKKTQRSSGDFISYKKNKTVYYLLEYYTPGKLMKFESIRNKNYYGANKWYYRPNIFGRQSLYLNYYKQKPPMISGNDSGFVFWPMREINGLLNNKKYNKKLINQDSLFLLELNDTTKQSQYDIVLKYYISKKDAHIVKAFARMSGLGETDSIFYMYNYYKIKKEKIIDRIDNFKPYTEIDEEAERKKYRDSLDFVLALEKTFPEFNLPDTSGILYKPLNSKYVLVDFWYKGCGPCLANMKNIEKVRRSFDLKHLDVITINMADSMDNNLKKIIQKYNTSFIWLMGGKDLCKEVHTYAYPTTFIYETKTREIIFRNVGMSEDYAEKITDFLNKRIN